MGTVPIFLAAVAAHAHGLHQREGTATVTKGRIVTVVQADAGSEQALLDELIVRDGDGRRLSGRAVSSAPAARDHATVRLEHALPLESRWLSFQLAPSEVSGARARRLVLVVDDGSSRRVVDLTSGGNVETLRFPEAEAPAGCGPALLDAHPERMRSVMASLLRGDSGSCSRLDIVMPLGMLESFLPIARADPDVLSEAEQAAARGAVFELVRSRISPRASGGAVAFLGLDDPAIGSAPSRALGAWTARVRVSLELPDGGPVRWGLFNGLVLTARVVILQGSLCEERRVSTYEPRIE